MRRETIKLGRPVGNGNPQQALKRLRLGAPRHSLAAGFTLTELLIVISIIALLSAMGFSVYTGATQLARAQRTNSMIARIDQLIMERYEGYRTRAVPIRSQLSSTANRVALAQTRLNAMRDLMRMELPDRITDIVDFSSGSPLLQPSVTGMPSASLQQTYFRAAVRALGGNPNNTTTFSVLLNWSPENQGAECLYLILSTMRDGDKSALDYFTPDEIGDTDNPPDGMKEILDGWGTPIAFIRWPAGYAEKPGPDGAWGFAGQDDDGDGIKDNATEAGWVDPVKGPSDDVIVQTPQTRNYRKAPDPFDPVKVDPRWGTFVQGPADKYALVAPQPYALYPLIYSAGQDKLYDIDPVPGLIYTKTAIVSTSTSTPSVPPVDPYFVGTSGYPGANGVMAIVGQYGDVNGDGTLSYSDNITNHAQRTK